MTSQSPEGVLFKEVQKPDQVWLNVLIYGVAALMWYGFVQQIFFGIPFGTNPAPDAVLWIFWLLIGIGLPAVFQMIVLVVEVKTDHILVKYNPFVTRKFYFAEIKQFTARTYSPLREYGGWGIKGGFGSGRRAYTMSGNTGVELTLLDGDSVMLGSQKPEALAQAIVAQSGADKWATSP